MRSRRAAGATLAVALGGLLAGILTLLVLSRPARCETPALAREQGERVLALVQPFGPFRLAQASQTEFWLELVDPAGRAAGILRLLRAHEDRPHRFRTKSFGIEIGNVAPSPKIIETLVKAAHGIAEQDDGSWATKVPGERRIVPVDLVWATMAFVSVAVIIAAWKNPRVSWEVRLPHLLPAAIQILLYAYWSLYWPDVGEHVPSLLLQLVMGFAADAAFSFARFGSWRIGASPLPIILSANLFAWFDTPGIVISIVTAFATKTFLRRDGRHVLNPSAAGLTLGGLCTAVAPDSIHFGGVFHTMNVAPNFAELIIVLALLPQLRFRIVPVSIGALLALRSYHNPAIARPAILLAIVLFATDPATIPRTDVGKLLFGAFVGLGIGLASVILRSAGVPDDFSKVMPIPIANALVPLFDRLGSAVNALLLRAVDARRPLAALLSKMGTWGPTAAGPRGWVLPNAALVACWLAVVLPAFGEEKRSAFEPALFWTWGTPLVVRDADDVPRCPANPVFCQPFSFYEEVSAWRRRSTAVAY
jgi:hypothetical protein